MVAGKNHFAEEDGDGVVGKDKSGMLGGTPLLRSVITERFDIETLEMPESDPDPDVNGKMTVVKICAGLPVVLVIGVLTSRIDCTSLAGLLRAKPLSSPQAGHASPSTTTPTVPE